MSGIVEEQKVASNANPYQDWLKKGKFMDLGTIQNLKEAGAHFFKGNQEKLADLRSFLGSIEKHFSDSNFEL